MCAESNGVSFIKILITSRVMTIKFLHSGKYICFSETFNVEKIVFIKLWSQLICTAMYSKSKITGKKLHLSL